MNNDKLMELKEAIKKAQEGEKDNAAISKLVDPEALEKFRARFKEMLRKAEEKKENKE